MERAVLQPVSRPGRPAGRRRSGARALLRVRATAETAVIVLFLTVLALPLVGMGLGWGQSTAGSENRRLAALPAFSLHPEALAALPGGLRRYFRDHFGFRGLLVHWHHYIKYYGLRVSPDPMVIAGKDGWLYYAGERSVQLCRHSELFTEEQLARWTRVLEDRREWLSQRGIPFVFVVAPAKESIYPEYLPDAYRPVQKQSHLDQLLEYLQAHSTFRILDLRPSLWAAKGQELLYYRTDTHWNARGALVAYRAIAPELQKVLPALRPAPESQLRVIVQGSRQGDLALMAGLQDSMNEDRLVVARPLSPMQRLPPLQGEDPSPPGLRRPMVYRQEGSRLPRVVVFRDSFARELLPLLLPHFGEAVVISDTAFDPQVIAREKPDLVIQELTERHILGPEVMQNAPEVTAASSRQQGPGEPK